MPFLYFSWIVISVILLGLCVYFFLPRENDKEFYLLTDFTLLFFLPSFFALVLLAIHFIGKILDGSKIKMFLIVSVLLLAFIYVFVSMDYGFLIKLFAVLAGFIIAMGHAAITEIIYRLAWPAK